METAAPSAPESGKPQTGAPTRKRQSRAAAPKKARPSATAPSRRSGALTIPPILLEGDRPETAAASSAIAPPLSGLAEPLPEAYGTQRLWLVARDPDWLYAHWDLTRAQQRQYNQQTAGGHLTLRLHAGAVGPEPVAEIRLHPESRHWFVPIERPAEQFIAELGFHPVAGEEWQQIAVSNPVSAPTRPGPVAVTEPVRFAAIPVDVPLASLAKQVASKIALGKPLAEALREKQLASRRTFPLIPPPSPDETGPRAAAEDMDRFLHELLALEIAEREAMQTLPVPGPTAADWPLPGAELGSPAGGLGISSPVGASLDQVPRGFRLAVHAELILYGQTEPDATVLVAGRPVLLVVDGTFQLPIALPDGSYELPVTAIAADRRESRAVTVRITRATEPGEPPLMHGDPGCV